MSELKFITICSITKVANLDSIVKKNFSYSETGRRPAIWVLLIIVCFFGVLIWVAPHESISFWVIVVIWTVSSGMVLYMLIANPVFGSEISEETWRHYGPNLNFECPIRDIDWIDIKSWSDSTDYTLVLRSGRKVSVPSNCLPTSQKLEPELIRFGIKATQT